MFWRFLIRNYDEDALFLDEQHPNVIKVSMRILELLNDTSRLASISVYKHPSEDACGIFEFRGTFFPFDELDYIFNTIHHS